MFMSAKVIKYIDVYEHENHKVQASALIKEICRNLHTAAESVKNADYTVVLRGDSTLRGHFPEASDLKYFSID